LRGPDKEAFDTLMNMARSHASASSTIATPNPVEAVFMSILVELQKEINNLHKQIEEMRKEIRRTRND
jgi:hypothetical protein